MPLLAPSSTMLRFGSRAFSAAAVRPVKLSTGVVGLDVVPNAREVLTSLYTRTLAEVQVMPETVFYRQSVEKFTRYRLDVVAKTTDIDAIESEIGCGQVEELIEQAKSELQLIPLYASWRMWEEPAPTPQDDDFSHIYEEIKFLDGKERVEQTGMGRQASRMAKALGSAKQ